MSMQNYGKSMLRLKLPQPTINDNLTNTIHEKLMTVKSKNRELTIKMLNLQATIAKNNSSSRRSKYESQYTRNM